MVGALIVAVWLADTPTREQPHSHDETRTATMAAGRNGRVSCSAEQARSVCAVSSKGAEAMVATSGAPLTTG